jgi:hypothetical protein
MKTNLLKVGIDQNILETFDSPQRIMLSVQSENYAHTFKLQINNEHDHQRRYFRIAIFVSCVYLSAMFESSLVIFLLMLNTTIRPTTAILLTMLSSLALGMMILG